MIVLNNKYFFNKKFIGNNLIVHYSTVKPIKIYENSLLSKINVLKENSLIGRRIIL
jgi:hypothetical protein